MHSNDVNYLKGIMIVKGKKNNDSDIDGPRRTEIHSLIDGEGMERLCVCVVLFEYFFTDYKRDDPFSLFKKRQIYNFLLNC